MHTYLARNIHLFILLLVYVKNISIVYKAPPMFYSQLCRLNQVGPSNSGTFTCTTAAEQAGIIRVGLALTQYAKPANNFHQFTASASYGADPTSSFNILANVAQPSTAIRLSFSLIVIKTQSSPFIDLITLTWGPGTSMDNNNNIDRPQVQSADVSTSTIIPSGTSGLKVIPFTTWFKMVGPTLGASSNFDMSKNIKFQLKSSITGTMTSTEIKAKPLTKIYGYSSVVVIYDEPKITSILGATFNTTVQLKSFAIGANYSLQTNLPSFGPNFNSKCILGTQKLQYKGSDSFDLYFTNTSFSNYQVYSLDLVGTAKSDSDVFCFGLGIECGQGGYWMDLMSYQCYVQAQNCPLPVPDLWIQPNMCPNCTQLICQKCPANDRSNCQLCGPNSILAHGVCSCKPNYAPITTYISTSSLGLWNNVSNSLTICQLICPAVLPGCKPEKCTNQTFCSQCEPGYYLNIISTTAQSCILCSSVIPNCLQCTSGSVCTKCDTTYYITSTYVCDLCSNPFANCQKCLSPANCLTCKPYYSFNALQTQCLCDPVKSSLSNCLTCLIPTECSVCISNQYYLSTTNKMCYPCTLNHAACSTCVDSNHCLTCQTGFFIQTLATGKITCDKCLSFLTNCTTCTSPSVCTNCDISYGLTSTSKCQLCTTLLSIPQCVQCQDASGCLVCNTQTVVFQGTCQYCENHVYKCQNCAPDISNTYLVCTKCEDGYSLVLNPLTGKLQCKSCLKTINFCGDCFNNVCLRCMFPYILGPDNLCTLCQPGYHMNLGYCSKLPGCQKPVILANGSQACIVCIPQLNYVYDPKTMKCVCNYGFKETYQIGSLSKCVTDCGDGIIVAGFQECDDKNTFSNDGCNEYCRVQTDFQCVTEPSKCILKANFNTLTFNYAYRVLGQNRGILSFSLSPKHDGLLRINWSKMLKLNFSITSVNPQNLQYAYSPETGQLLIKVQYSQELESTFLQANLTFDPQKIISQPSSMKLVTQLKGINAPLAFQPRETLSNYSNVKLISTILIILIILQFYVASYFHKMIGLETIQLLQSIYFFRLVIDPKKTSVLNAMNVLKYSIAGYNDANGIFAEKNESLSQSSGLERFVRIDLKADFLLNANFCLIPLIIAAVVYLICLVRKYKARSNYIFSLLPQQKDKYIILRRRCQWIYDHFFFPFTMMFNLICFFQTILQLCSSNSQSSLSFSSFSFHLALLFITTAIYCNEIFLSFEEFSHLINKKVPKRSIVEELQYDANNPDKANFHPLYVLVHFVYYILLEFFLAFEFKYTLEFVFALVLGYFLLITCWKPYHSCVNYHNQFLKAYYITIVIFVAVGFLMEKISLTNSIYSGMIYMIMILISIVFISGCIRILLQVRFRKILVENISLLNWNSVNDSNKSSPSIKNKPLTSLDKKALMIQNNKYRHQNQQKLKKDLVDSSRYEFQSNLLKKPQFSYQKRQVSPEHQRLLLKKLSQNSQQKNLQHPILVDYRNNQLNRQKNLSLTSNSPFGKPQLQIFTNQIDQSEILVKNHHYLPRKYSQPIESMHSERRDLQFIKQKLRNQINSTY